MNSNTGKILPFITKYKHVSLLENILMWLKMYVLFGEWVLG